MIPQIFAGTFPLPAVSVKEVLRYAGTKEDDSESLRLLEECIKEADLKTGKVSYCTLPVTINENEISFGAFSTVSKYLSSFFKTSEKTVLFAATIGLEFDRLIAKYSLISPAKALMLQALGSERVEALCDTFSDYIKEEWMVQSVKRFSPGYGDLPLSLQKEIIPLLQANKNCGIFLNDSLLLTPSKTVTAFIKASEE